MEQHIKFMRRALELAGHGLGTVSPNPMVGCVLVNQDKIIGEGWHQTYGGAHAEVNAINAVHDKSALSKSTLYVNLEPCSHHGKTPPCADLIISSGIKHVVVANQDPNPLVAGQGISKLRNAGIEVLEGVLKDQGDLLNKRFFTFHQKKRPYIILKWAETSDGFIARPNHDSKWISNEHSRQLVHKYRAEEDAIMVGRKTAKYDNPELTVRLWSGTNPVRIVIDPELSLDNRIKLYDGSVPTLCYNRIKNVTSENLELVKIPKEGIIPFILNDLYQRNIQSLLVEGGATLLNSFILPGYWDEARVFVAAKKFEKGVKAPFMKIDPRHQRLIDQDELNIYYFQDT